MPTHYTGDPKEVRALNTLIKLSRAAESLGATLLQDLADFNITPGQFGVLETLLHLGPKCQSELGKKLLRSNPNMTAVLDNLEKNGLIQRQRHGEDRRMILISLTAKGKELISKVFPIHVKRLVELMAVLSDEEQEDLGKLCKKLGIACAAHKAAV